MLRVLIAIADEIRRKGVRAIIEPHDHWKVCAETADGPEALELALREGAHIAVVDMALTGLNGIALTRRLTSALPEVKVLLLAAVHNEEIMRAGLAAGARGYLLMSDSGAHLTDAVSALQESRAYVAPPTRAQTVPASSTRFREAPYGFTRRELEVGQLIAEGNTNKQIARLLCISVKTVESHRTAAMRKAGAATAVQFARFAIRNNLVQV